MKHSSARHRHWLRVGTLVFTATLLLGFSLEGSVVVPEFGSDGGPEATSGDPDHGAFGLPGFLQDDDPAIDPEVFETEKTESILPEHYVLQSEPWSAPDYSGQDGFLGWKADLFKTPAGLEDRVAFWKEIYSKYTTDQGVLHDSEDLRFFYEMVDFSSIMKDPKLSLRAKARARTKLVKERRADIAKRLERLSKLKSESDIRDDVDRRILGYFSKTPISQLKDLKPLRESLRQASRKKRIRFQLGQRDKFILGIYYSGRHIRAMEKIFRDEKLPVELTRLPFVESSFNTAARSRVGASGIWQFMPRTAKPWMMVNRDVDERNDPITATHAAAKLMRNNYDRLAEWPLALTAYNHGAAGIARAVRKTGSRDIARIIESYSSRRFGFASSNFYACFLAALEVERDAKKIFGDVKWSSVFDSTEIKLAKSLPWRTVIDIYGGDQTLAEVQNPHINRRVRTAKPKSKGRDIPAKTFIRVPEKSAEAVRDFLAGKFDEKEFKSRLAKSD